MPREKRGARRRYWAARVPVGMWAWRCGSCCRIRRATSPDKRWWWTVALLWLNTPANPSPVSGKTPMARLPYLDKSDLPPEQQDLLDRPINLMRALVHSPNATRAFSGLGQFIRRTSRLDPRLRELAILQVGYLARSPYEYSHHIKIGYDFGVSDADVRAMIEETEGRASALEPLAKAVLLAARQMTDGRAVDDATFAALRRDLGEERLTDLVITIAFYCGVVRLLATLEIDVEPDYRQYLEAFPFPSN